MKKTTVFSIISVLLLTACVGERGPRGLDGKQGSAGVNGINGQDGVDAVIEIIDPCGKQADYDEVILRLADKTLLAVFRKANKEFFIVLSPGNYVTTDGTNCKFTVTDDLLIINEHN